MQNFRQVQVVRVKSKPETCWPEYKVKSTREAWPNYDATRTRANLHFYKTTDVKPVKDGTKLQLKKLKGKLKVPSRGQDTQLKFLENLWNIEFQYETLSNVNKSLKKKIYGVQTLQG